MSERSERIEKDRDRDSGGRARSARPRDATGRPLAPGAPGIPRAPEGIELTPSQALAEAERLLGADLPFQAHDVFEDLWKRRRSAGASDTVLWQGLAQLCVGLTHLQRGNRTGAVALLRRGADNLAAFVDVPGVHSVAEWAGAAAEVIEAGRDGFELPPFGEIAVSCS